MAMPRTLKNFNLFNDGNSYMGQVEEVTLPKLTRKMEEYRGGGMIGAVQLDMGQEKVELEWKCAGFMRGVLEQYGAIKIDGVPLRFAGAYQRDDTAAVDAVEIVVRGRHVEIDPGSAKVGEKTEFAVKTAAAYYKLSVNGSTVIELDFVNGIEVVNGTDLYADIRAAIGL